MSTLTILSGVCDLPLARFSSRQETVAFLLTRLHCLDRLEVWEQEPCSPGSCGMPADQWLLLQDAQGNIEWPAPPACTHRHTIVKYWPTDHLACLDCQAEVA